MKNLAIIPVLGKKESFPKMFSHFLVNKPLILYICESAKKAKSIEDIYILTEDDNIKHIAEINDIKYIEISISNYNNDNYHNIISEKYRIIEKIEKKSYDNVIILEANCPLIKSESIDKSIKDLISSGSDTAISVKISVNREKKRWKENEKGYGVKEKGISTNIIKSTNEYQEISGIIISTKRNLLENNSLIGDKVKLIKLAFPENLEIKNHFDWWNAEKYLQRKRILIRVDGYDKIGLGHIYRTLSLANQLIDHTVLFVTKSEYQLGIKLIREHNYDFKTFETNRQYEEIIDSFKPQIIINDILDTTSEYINSLRKRNIFIVNFEDLGDGTKRANLVINALYKRKNFLENHYWGKDFYILREEFFLVGQKNIKKDVKNILITYGGTDPNNYTGKVLKVIDELRLKNVKIVVILGLGYKHYEELKKIVDKMDLQVIIKQHIRNISKYMYEADIAFTAAGRSVYELASIGTPTIVLVENERGLLHTFASKKNGIITLGLGYQIPDKDIKETLVNIINKYDLRKTCNQLMLKNDLRSGVKNVISLIFSQFEKFEREQKV